MSGSTEELFPLGPLGGCMLTSWKSLVRYMALASLTLPCLTKPHTAANENEFVL